MKTKPTCVSKSISCISIAYSIIFLLFINIGYSQRTIEESFEKVCELSDICFYEIPLVSIEKYDIKRSISYDTLTSIRSTKNIIHYLKSMGRIERMLTDTTINSKIPTHYYNLVNELNSIQSGSDTVFSFEFSEAINKYEERYICFVIQNGFYCTDRLMRKRNITSIIISVVTIGMMIPLPVMSVSTIHFLVYDKNEKMIVYKDKIYDRFYNDTEMPFYKNTTDNQISSLLYRIQKRIEFNKNKKNKKRRKS